MSTTSWNRPLVAAVVLAAVIGLGTPTALATVIYNHPGPFFSPLLAPTSMPGLSTPAYVPGKEYSHDLDSTTLGAGPTPPPPADPEQVVNWDGFGGAADGLDYSLTRSAYPADDQVDALANFYDTLFMELLDDKAHLAFSIDDTMTAYASGTPSTGPLMPSAGPIPLSGGSVIGGAGELSYERAGAFGPAGQGLWAAQAAINAEPLPTDVDGVELWGPEPDPGGAPPVLGDANKYSLDSDYASFNTAISGDAVSVWNLNGTAFVPHSMIVSLVTALLGTPAGVDPEDVPALVNVDALMVQNKSGASPNVFDAATPNGPDMILFSIRQISDPADPSGYYATGSELFVLDGAGSGGFLWHGGHAWDKSYAVGSLSYEVSPGLVGVVDVNALEAIAVPEPAGLVLLVAGLAAAAWRRLPTASSLRQRQPVAGRLAGVAHQ